MFCSQNWVRKVDYFMSCRNELRAKYTLKFMEITSMIVPCPIKIYSMEKFVGIVATSNVVKRR